MYKEISVNTKDDFQLLTLIRRLELFRELDADQAKLLLGLCERNAYEAGETAWLAGDKSSHMLVLLSGGLRVIDAEKQEIGQVSPGEVFGEMSVLTGHARFAGIEAVEASTALSLSGRTLWSMVGEHQGIYVKILETAVDILSHRLTHTGHSRH